MNKKTIAKIILGLTIVIIIGLYFLNPKVNSRINYIFMLFSSMSVESIIGYIRSFGPYAVAVSFLLMVFQSVAAPLPAFLITFANAAIWGWWRGAILSWSSAMAGAKNIDWLHEMYEAVWHQLRETNNVESQIEEP